MESKSEYVVKDWNLQPVKLSHFIWRTAKGYAVRLFEATSVAWFKEQYLRFKLRKLGPSGVRNLFASPIQLGLKEIGYSDALTSKEIGAIAFRLNDSLYATVQLSEEHRCICTFSKRTGVTYRSTSIEFEIANEQLGNILGTRVDFRYGVIGTGGGGLRSHSESTFNHLVELASTNLEVTSPRLISITAKQRKNDE